MVDIQAQLWIWDREITSFMVLNTALDSNSNFRFILLCLEWSMHGGLWLIFSLLISLVSMRYNFSLNTKYGLVILTFGLCVDLIIVGAIKGIVRRPRPPSNIKDQLYEAPLVDKFSFPSGHSSRGAMLSVLCLEFCSFSPFITLTVNLLPFILGASRVFIGRHYASDVIMGLLIGYAEGYLVQCLPANVTSVLLTQICYHLIA
ncbi:unnamed protein product [Litomosoides sigmodontis]|uniref:Phosphatidic acid phosphatase type 2/haloperoxidase domain-containing protein n=1 Tax=Litomosoides sigmodontis TaxID=42156 RepID=A0A3P7JQ40_LITSI|nr:unnamed protein product [Litomosoides sigmodontis]